LDVPNVDTAWLMYETGRVDWLLSLEASFAPELVARHRDDIHVFPAFGTYFYNFNCEPRMDDGRPNPFADARVRRAFAIAIDRAAICSHLMRCGETPATDLIPPQAIPGYPTVAGISYDPAAARTLFRQAGWTSGRDFPEVVLLYSNEAGHGLIAQSI